MIKIIYYYGKKKLQNSLSWVQNSAFLIVSGNRYFIPPKF